MIMTRYFFTFLALLISTISFSQKLNGEQLLEKAINYHDPNGAWPSLHAQLNVIMSTPDGKDRLSEISMDLPMEYFKLSSLKEGVKVEQTVSKGDCELALNGSSDFSDEDAKTHGLSCERANMYKNYYTYLYGLPMKLKDPGTIIDPKTERKTFKNKEYLVLKVTYEKEVGEDIWYFYFDQKTYAMEVYQFFHDESKNDGEYILLSGMETISGIKMPKSRAWYYNKDDAYLGTDVLVKATSL